MAWERRPISTKKLRVTIPVARYAPIEKEASGEERGMQGDRMRLPKFVLDSD
jgi:hypothetical protein